MKRCLYAGTIPIQSEIQEYLGKHGVMLSSNMDGVSLTEPRLLELIRDCDAVIASSEKYTERVFSAAPKLKVVARTGVGYDNVDVDSATKRGIYVTWTPIPELAYGMAEHAMALALAVLKRTCIHNREVRNGRWERAQWIQDVDDIYHLTFGLLGAGRIGREVAKRARAFGARVIYNDLVRSKQVEQALELEFVSFDNLLSQSDVLSIHTPLTTQTRGIINENAIRKMKPNSIIINTARGEVIDERAVIAALESGRLRGAGLDVLSQEPPMESSPFYKLGDRVPNLILTPHLGYGRHTYYAMARVAVEDVVRILSDKPPKYSLNAQAIRR